MSDPEKRKGTDKMKKLNSEVLVEESKDIDGFKERRMEFANYCKNLILSGLMEYNFMGVKLENEEPSIIEIDKIGENSFKSVFLFGEMLGLSQRIFSELFFVAECRFTFVSNSDPRSTMTPKDAIEKIKGGDVPLKDGFMITSVKLLRSNDGDTEKIEFIQLYHLYEILPGGDLHVVQDSEKDSLPVFGDKNLFRIFLDGYIRGGEKSERFFKSISN